MSDGAAGQESVWKTAHWRRSILFVVFAGVACAALGWSAWRWTEARARAATDKAAATIAANHAGLLASELEKFRLLPLVLVEYPDVAAALAGDGAQQRLDRTLELLAARTNAAVIYAIDQSGRTVAASNWRLPTSFVGQDYSFRPYFIDAMRDGSAELFALGTVSGRPGLYLSRRVTRAGRTLGVVVVKVEFDRVEAQWARTPGVSVATDRRGIVLVTSRPDWRFHALDGLDRATAALARRTLQFGRSLPTRVPLSIAGKDASAPGEPVGYRVARTASPLAGGGVLHLAPLAPALTAARQQATLWALGLLFVVAVIAGATWRSAERRRLQREARAGLEREVAARTAELRDANARLSVESAERLAADQRYRTAREELALASRLGSLGQITAGVAHEINQPVAAIRTFAENGTILLDRAAPERARENLDHIVALTDRIGAITGELRAFSRRGRSASGNTTIGEVIDGLLLLMGERVRGALTLDVPASVRDTRVLGDRIRLEQVLVNLTQNALDATAGVVRQAIHLGVAASADTVTVRVSDNGTGIAPEVRDTLFTPFVTGRADGLGLGLAIARDIAREFGGELAVDDAPHLSGAGFVLTLRRAK
ncbi:two-component system, NtrC family, C4-dicarboxylate transport sensor histidine kinase DctB [Sphingomonas palmae]|uniref:C4-dicarboxylate transport sensor protein DctB n=1 Tax=Sphingomonas palmae TaxID=1855283 RepID=A0A1H7MM21_9SPHN|nr:ATP-binding protein [Sphingomonas palmae]SEL12129.1 two-component system, NtrC family, C4-dicarboxylate transport sensor histidine kinase DctB [Sphingomonas palmae]